MKRNIYKASVYADIMDYKCANPNCKSGKKVEAHHIVPVYWNGLDKYVNMITLCRKCHRSRKFYKKLHKKPTKEQQIELLTWKFYLEQKILGFTSDTVSDRGFTIKAQRLKEAKKRAIGYIKTETP